MNKKKVLSLGLNQINFIEQLYGSLKSLNSDLTFDVDNFINHGTLKPSNNIVDNYYSFSTLKFPFSYKIIYGFKILLRRLFWKQFYLEIHTNGFKKIFSFLKKSSRDYFIATKHILPKKHDIYHFHSIVKPNVRYLQYLPKDKTVICTFWGLDLYQRWGTNNYYYISLALDRATYITVQSLEMKEVVIAKYGAKLKDKIKVITFPLKQTIFNLIDELKDDDEKIKAFKLKIGVKDLNKKIVSIGYNASQNNQHLKILQTLDKLPVGIKRQYTMVIPMSYGREESYIAELNNQLKKCKDLDVICLDEYLNWNELALLKIISQVIIQLPFNDALSSAVIEVMFAGNIAITGDWLPYKVFKKNHINHIEVSKIDEIVDVLSDENTFNLETSDNNQIIRNLFLSDNIVKDWNSLYLN